MKNKLNILITGTNAMEAKVPARGYKIQTSVIAVKAALESKHTVTQRPIEPGEKLKEFDVIIDYPATIGGWSSAFVFGSFYAKSVGKKVVTALDDWQTATVIPSIVGFMKHLDKNFTKGNVFDRAPEWKKYQGIIADGATKFMSPWTNILAPTFYGEGVLEDLGIKVAHPTLACLFDPSMFFAQPDGEHTKWQDHQRELRWVYSSLTNRTKWLEQMKHSRWLLETYGNKTSGHERLTEAELIMRYAKSWGVLSPPTGLASGMWWRARYLHAIEAGAILAGDASETLFCGDGYEMDPLAIERAPTTDLRKIRDRQREEYMSRTWSKERLYSTLCEFVETIHETK